MEINFLAVLVSGLFSIFFGFFWFGRVFRPLLDRLNGGPAKGPPLTRAVMMKSMAIGLVSALLTSAGIALALDYWKTSPLAAGTSPLCFLLAFWGLFLVPFQINKAS